MSWHNRQQKEPRREPGAPILVHDENRDQPVVVYFNPFAGEWSNTFGYCPNFIYWQHITHPKTH